jgi:hypothetical protein
MIPAAILAPAIGSIAETIAGIIDSVHTSDEERLQAALEAQKLGIEEAKISAGLLQGQMAVNVEEAKHSSVFVAGWRPAVGWVGVLGLLYQFVLYPLMIWGWAMFQAWGWVPGDMRPPPLLDVDALIVLLGAILGIGAARTVEKVKGVAQTR